MNKHDHSREPTLSTPPTLSDSFDPARKIENTAKHGVSSDPRAERVDRVALRKGALLAGMFGGDGPEVPEPVPPAAEPTSGEPPADESPGDDRTEELTAAQPPPMGSACVCQFCESTWLVDSDDPPGIRCDDCGRLVWIDDGETLRKVGWYDHDLAAMAPSDLPTCAGCGRLCDVEKFDGAWHCARCFPNDAANRRKRTEELTRYAATLKRYHEPRNG